MRALVLVTLLPACSIAIGELDPSPNVQLISSQRTLALRFDPAVAESFTMPTGGAVVTAINVDRWHESIARGFRKGPAAFFATSPNAGADLILVIRRADVKMQPDGKNNHIVLTYEAQLFDRAQQPIKTWTDHVDVLLQMEAGYDVETSVRTCTAAALARMFENIATTIPAPPRTTP